MLRLENISKYYYSSTSVTCALRKINLEFNIGEFVAISGESGSGKTTLLNLISGFDSYEDGEFYFNGKQTSYFDQEDWEKYRKEEIAFIFQNYNLIDSFSVLENVIVTYIIDGYSYKEAKQKAKGILKLVGLDKDIHKKAIKLSGGQKQRLSIARALAKETKIIVADEPTGNLDAENGTAILKLLKELSKDKLVIVVTHNLGQIEPFITRKVRLHDGEVVIDEKIEEIKIEDKVDNDKSVSEKTTKTILNFSFLNLKSQPMKTILLMLLVTIMTFASFVFYANFKANLDDNKTRELENAFFENFDDTRLLVKDNEVTTLSDAILHRSMVNHVKSVEKYDLITDINYYRPGDYKMRYGGGYPDPSSENPAPGFVDSSAIVLENHKNYMRSASGLTSNMLSHGTLPIGNLEMVVYSNDPDIIGTKEMVLFRNAKLWGEATWYEYYVTIVGILKTPTKQAYFSDDICNVMEMSTYQFNATFYYDEYRYSRYNQRNLVFNRIVIDPELEGYQMSFPKVQKTVLSFSEIRLRNSNNLFFNNTDNKDWYTIECNLNKVLKVSDAAIGMSYEAFNSFYNYFKNRTQFAVFIDDYAYTDDVIKELNSIGFDALSCFRASVTGYDVTKVIFRYVNLVVSIIALLIVNLIAVLIAFSIMKVKKNDYIIFKMLGLTNKLCKKINLIEVLIYAFISTIILIITFIFVNSFVYNETITGVLKYIKFYDFIIVYLISNISMIFLSRKFSNYISKSVKITLLKEE